MSLNGQWTPSKGPVSRKQAVRPGRIPWKPGAVAERQPMSAAYTEELATRLAAIALIPIDVARQHVAAVGIPPLEPQRPHHKMY
jgi:hypothetical protein